MPQHPAPPKVRPTQWQWWQKVARRIRVPLGFVTAAVFLVEVARRPSHPVAIAWSLALVLPGLALRAAASGTVKKNRELTVTGPYAYTRNPLYLGSMLIAAGFAVALMSWPVALLVAGRIRGDLRTGDCLGGALFARHVRQVRGLLPPRATLHPALHCGQVYWRSGRGARFRGCSGRYGWWLLFRALPQASRVQCCNRGHTALPEPALPSAGAGSPPAPGG